MQDEDDDARAATAGNADDDAAAGLAAAAATAAAAAAAAAAADGTSIGGVRAVRAAPLRSSQRFITATDQVNSRPMANAAHRRGRRWTTSATPPLLYPSARDASSSHTTSRAQCTSRVAGGTVVQLRGDISPLKNRVCTKMSKGLVLFLSNMDMLLIIVSRNS